MELGLPRPAEWTYLGKGVGWADLVLTNLVPLTANSTGADTVLSLSIVFAFAN